MNIGKHQNDVSVTETETGIRLKHLAQINPSKSEISSLDPESEVTFVPLKGFGTNGHIQEFETRELQDVYDQFTYFRE